MKITFPHMGNVDLTITTLLTKVGLEVVAPPPCSAKTLSLGVQYSPEFACLPLKINLGNYLEAHELGANTAIMIGGIGPCRIGYYGTLQQEILRDMGIDMEIIVIEPPHAYPKEFWERVQKVKKVSWKGVIEAIYFAYQKTRALDILEEQALLLRAREQEKGSFDQLLKQAKRQLLRAESRAQIKKLTAEYLEKMKATPLFNPDGPPLSIVLVGEIYTVFEPFVNLNLERQLNHLGVEVKRPLFLSTWINEHLFGGVLPIEGTKRTPVLAKPFLNAFVGGHGRETVGSAVQYAREEGVDGIIQIAPLTCMPEIVAHSVLPKVGKEYGVPTMSIYVDEQTGEAGLLTRLEAFVDMIRYRQRRVK